MQNRVDRARVTTELAGKYNTPRPTTFLFMLTSARAHIVSRLENEAQLQCYAHVIDRLSMIHKLLGILAELFWSLLDPICNLYFSGHSMSARAVQGYIMGFETGDICHDVPKNQVYGKSMLVSFQSGIGSSFDLRFQIPKEDLDTNHTIHPTV